MGILDIFTDKATKIQNTIRKHERKAAEAWTRADRYSRNMNYDLAALAKREAEQHELMIATLEKLLEGEQ